MANPVIGVPLMGTSLARRYMQEKYTQCLVRAGATVQILQPTKAPAVLKGYLTACSGFLFPGGADIAPALYRQRRQRGCGRPNLVRDSFEVPLLRAALAADKPVLCICRGMQLLNVVQGGTLFQDIQPVQAYKHVDFAHRSGSTHTVDLQAGSMAAKIFPSTRIMVNSLHHQAVDRLGRGLCATAKSPEGFVEAIEFPKREVFTLGVQWHPEHMAAKEPSQQKIFEIFVSECGKQSVDAAREGNPVSANSDKGKGMCAMSRIKNEPKIKFPLIVAIREQLEHRALWMYLLCDEARKKGLSSEEYAPAAIRRCGLYQGGLLRRKAGGGASLKGLRKTLFSKFAQWVFEMDIKRCDDDHLDIDFRYCPLVKAWQKQGCSDEEICTLCDHAMCGDRGIAESFGCELDLPATIARGDDVCQIRFVRRGKKQDT